MKLDPNVEPCMLEIIEVLKKHDCCGIIGVVGQGHSGRYMHMEASWSKAKMNPDMKSITIPSNGGDMLTTGMISELSRLGGGIQDEVDRMIDQMVKNGITWSHRARMVE